MAILRILTTGFILLLQVSIINAQTGNKVNEAFARSYKSELNGNYTQGVADLKSVYKADDYSINARLGWLLFLSKQYTESVNYYDKAIRLKPYAIEARFGIIKACNALESWDRVKGEYEAILKIDSQNSTSLYWLGVLLYNRKEYDMAAKNFEKIVNLYPMDYGSVIMLAWTKFYQGKKTDAKVLFEHAILLSPEDPSATDGLNLLK